MSHHLDVLVDYVEQRPQGGLTAFGQYFGGHHWLLSRTRPPQLHHANEPDTVRRTSVPTIAPLHPTDPAPDSVHKPRAHLPGTVTPLGAYFGAGICCSSYGSTYDGRCQGEGQYESREEKSFGNHDVVWIEIVDVVGLGC